MTATYDDIGILTGGAQISFRNVKAGDTDGGYKAGYKIK